MEDRQLSVLASGKGTLISHLCEPEQRGHNINEGLVIVPIIIAMSKRLNWMMKRGAAGTASTFYNYAQCQKQTFNFCMMNHSDLISVVKAKPPPQCDAYFLHLYLYSEI